MPLNVDMPSNVTVEQKGACTVHVHTTGVEKQRCMVRLAVTTDRQKLLPLCHLQTEDALQKSFPQCAGARKRVNEC